MIAFEARCRLHGGRIRACFGFGQTKACDDLTGGNARQIFLLLRLGTKHHEALCADANIGAKARTESRAGAAKLKRHTTLGLHR